MTISHVLGVDDAPFDRAHRGDVPIVGTVYAGLRLEAVAIEKVRRDGANATAAIARMMPSHVHAVLLQGIALAGFNVVDIHALGVPVVVVVRKRPDFAAIGRALAKLPGGGRKWRLIERAGPIEAAGPVWIQRAGIELEPARALVARLSVAGNIPEPLRAAHLIAGALATGRSHGRV